MLGPLVQASDAEIFGLTVTDAAIDRASARVRGYLRQRISAGTSTITARGPVFRLPERPVREVISVTQSGAPVAFETQGSLVTVDAISMVAVTYSHGYLGRVDAAGYPDMPDELIEMVCQVASRLSSPPDPSLASGIQQTVSGPFTSSFGMDAWRGQSALTVAEKELLRTYWPTLPTPIIMGTP